MGKNKILIISVLAFVAGGIYYSGTYVYFLKKEVMEERPIPAGMEPEQAGSAVKVLKSGSFIDADFLHKGSGQAFLLEYRDGRKILRFENLNVTNGPDLYVYLVRTTEPTGDLGSLGDFIDLGRLKGNMGNQNYEIAGDASGYNTAVIWCKKFGVLFPYAVIR